MIKQKDFKFKIYPIKYRGLSIPTLYKQYSEINYWWWYKILDFNIDKNFGDCIDRFILVEVDKIKDSARKRYIEKE